MRFWFRDDGLNGGSVLDVKEKVLSSSGNEEWDKWTSDPKKGRDHRDRKFVETLPLNERSSLERGTEGGEVCRDPFR